MLELDAPLVKGGWCLIYGIKGKPELCAKVLIPKRRYKGTKPEPDIIVRAKYGISDFLEYEMANYQKIMAGCPQNLRSHFVSIHGIQTVTDGRKALVMEVVRDDSGGIAPNLVHNTRTLLPKFWTTLERIRQEVFIAHGIDHFGIMRRNILVRSPEDPVLLDFQTGRERFPGQFWLRHPWFIKQKVNRCFRNLYSEMGVNPERYS